MRVHVLFNFNAGALEKTMENFKYYIFQVLIRKKSLVYRTINEVKWTN